MTLRLELAAQEGRSETIFEFDSRTVVLGANGVGKSRLLRRISEIVFEPPRRLIQIEGGRAVKPLDAMQGAGAPPPPGNFNTLEGATQSYNAQRDRLFVDRIQSAFLLMWRQSHYQSRIHSNAAEAYRLGGAVGPMPVRPEDPLELIFRIFMELFPEISISLDPQTEHILCSKNGSEYRPTLLSDGEKQCLCLLADVFTLAPNDAIIVVDEPELNLHPSLACKFWDLVEERKVEATFIYATHCIAFALRSSVKKVIVLNRSGLPTVQVGPVNPHNLAHREFLGALPAIVSSTSAIAVEGRDNSIDSLFYRWLLKDHSVPVVPLGGCEDVIAAVTRLDIWRALTHDIRLVGVVDRDFRPDTLIDGTQTDAVVWMGLHEAESYLCIPDVVLALSRALGLREKELSREIIESAIMSRYEKAWSRVAVKRANARLGTVSVNVDAG